MYSRNIVSILAASLFSSTAVAQDLGTWALYCGSSCTDGTLIASGDAHYSYFTDCEAFSTPYQYCYLQCSGVCSEADGDRWFLADLFGSNTCSTSGGVYESVQPGECAEGPFHSYWAKLNL